MKPLHSAQDLAGSTKPLLGDPFEEEFESLWDKESFVLSIPEALDPAAAAPILCAGITTYSPLKHVGVKKGDKVGVLGMGGLGHMGVKFAKAMGAEVTIFTRSVSKVEEALSQGADHVIISTDEAQMTAAAEQFDIAATPPPTATNMHKSCSLHIATITQY